MRSPAVLWTALGYGALVAATAIGFLLIRRRGELLQAPAPVADEPLARAAAGPPDALLHVLIALVAVIVVGRILARLFRSVGQPPVIGEVVAGILLGPSLLGPELSAAILPPSAAPHLGLIAQLGVVLYMFMVGLDLDVGVLRGRAHATVATSHASILVPFLLGAWLALDLYPRLSSSDVPFTSFALFMGVAMSITAFPVLARILSDRGMSRTALGAVALSCAATDDVTAWCLLAFVVGVAKAEVGGALLVGAGTAVYIALMFFVVRPLLRRLAARWPAERPSAEASALVFVALLLSALATEAIGVHAVFGAFLLGAIFPRDSAVARSLASRLEHVVTVLLLPAFFAFTGMRTRIDLLDDAGQWAICAAIIVVATAGKFGGSFAAARLTGLGSRDAAALGALMNTRGLMELIVLNIGLDLGVIAPALFAMMVVMALATTMMTGPALGLLMPSSVFEAAVAVRSEKDARGA